MTTFTPLPAALGGLLIGISVLTLVLFDGRVAGISGIVGGGVRAIRNDLGWRIAFVGGLVLSALLYRIVTGSGVAASVSSQPAVLIVAGLLVGFGSRLGNGCTSGHGVCGVARLSPRGLAATGIFMLSAAATVFVTRHLVGG